MRYKISSINYIKECLEGFRIDPLKHWSEYPCMIWDRHINEKGYGDFRVGKIVRAHRFSYELVVGPIPDDLELDHICRNRACFCPAHVEPVTHKENIRRSLPYRIVEPKMYCKRGHPLIEGNTIGKHRRCKTCEDAYQSAIRRPRKTHCKNGHLFDEQNTARRKWNNGKPSNARVCKQCLKDRAVKRHAKHRTTK